MDWAIVCRTGNKQAPWRCTYGEVAPQKATDEEVYARVPQRLSKFLRGVKVEDVNIEQVARYNVHQRLREEFSVWEGVFGG